jgi:general secretion pathway protein N
VGLFMLAPVVMIGVIVLNAPASWLDVMLDRFTDGRVRLAQASGSFWNGQGRVVLVDPSRRGSDAVLQGLALPGQIVWSVSPWALLTGQVRAQFSGSALSAPVQLDGAILGEGARLRGSAASLSLPSVELGQLGSPWNTLQPVASLNISWQAFELRNGAFEGRMSIDLNNTASAISPVNPLGSYRVDVNALGNSAQVQLMTKEGALQLDGNGTWNNRQGLRFTASAVPSQEHRARLQSLMALLGRRDGDKTIIRIGA